MKQKNQIGNYQLGKLIGSGTFGKVQQATHRITGELVAIKTISKREMKLQKMSEKVKRELKVLTHFDHPHIIKLFEYIRGINEIYLVMELLQGGELYGLIERKGRLKENEARLLFQQLVSGVEYCHYHKVVHRDLKLENILLQDENTLKIVDFGLSNLIKEGEYFKTSCGSPNYAAPEVITGKMYCGSEVDVWSMGIILFTLLAGCLPFEEESFSNLIQKIKTANYSVPYYFSDHARDLIKRILVPDPLIRITIQQIKCHP